MSLFKKRSVDLGALTLEELPFSGRDLFVLLGGLDTTLVIKAGLGMVLEEVLELKPYEDLWKRDLVNRLQPSGWVDAEGNPNPELAAALAPLGSLGVAISNARKGDSRTRGVVLAGDSASGIVRSAGKIFHLTPFPREKKGWDGTFRRIFDKERYPFYPAARDWHATFVEPKGEDIASAFLRNDKEYIRAYAERRGVEAEPLLEFGGKFGLFSKFGELYVDQTVGCEYGPEYPWKYVPCASGPRRLRWAFVVPSIGGIFSDCSAGHAGVPDRWGADYVKWAKEVAFLSIDFYTSDSLLDALSSVPPYPETESEPA
ncbi:hypothetical protein [Olsenella sp. HMSC062G07]|uniref:hypothetical protein n=1 Tax=Olsenella sp. HMSC062G07 TaxID=1739330 RepID=UPI0008A4FD06|nr:hypothetical protein [Olsenella sp. HMSC062G07]OFK22492.1 hypothetical protein HMPREF2826_01735 [Olsenella sp. HMSC062G07]